MLSLWLADIGDFLAKVPDAAWGVVAAVVAGGGIAAKKSKAKEPKAEEQPHLYTADFKAISKAFGDLQEQTAHQLKATVRRLSDAEREMVKIRAQLEEEIRKNNTLKEWIDELKRQIPDIPDPPEF